MLEGEAREAVGERVGAPPVKVPLAQTVEEGLAREEALGERLPLAQGEGERLMVALGVCEGDSERVGDVV